MQHALIIVMVFLLLSALCFTFYNMYRDERRKVKKLRERNSWILTAAREDSRKHQEHLQNVVLNCNGNLKKISAHNKELQRRVTRYSNLADEHMRQRWKASEELAKYKLVHDRQVDSIKSRDTLIEQLQEQLAQLKV